MSKLSVLVIGAGELGMAMVQALHDHPEPFEISVMLRPSTITSSDPAKSTTRSKLQSLGAKLVPGDYVAEDEAALSRTFSVFYTVVVCAGFTDGASGVQTKITRAVLATSPSSPSSSSSSTSNAGSSDGGVRFYVPWQFGVDYDVLGAGTSQDSFDEQLEVRGLLRAQHRVGWAIVSVGVFMSFLFESWWGVVDLENDTVRALGGWNTRITTTAPEDIGRITAAILAEERKKKDEGEESTTAEVCFVSGETLSYGQLADSVERATGRPVKRELWDTPYLMKELTADPTNTLKKYRPIFARDTGIAWDHASSWNAKRGIKTLSTEEYARRLS